MSRPSVAIIGGGIAGLSAAHELRHANAEVTVYEAGHAVGGKARSHSLPNTGTQGRGDLPGEHGFRFYPSFYLHLTETMEQIPDPLSPTGTVAGNLVATREAGVTVAGKGLVASPRRPRTLAEVKKVFGSMKAAGATLKDMSQFMLAHFQWLSSCDQRRDEELEHLPWAQFVGIDGPGRYSEAFRQVLLATTRTMVAMDAERGSARTIGLASSMLLLDAVDSVYEVDRTMAGPTTDCWLDPWQRELEKCGVRFQFGQRAVSLEVNEAKGHLERAVMQRKDGSKHAIQADVYVLAVPIEAACGLASENLVKHSDVFAGLRDVNLETTTSWMTGAQYYLSEDIPLVGGHAFFPDTPWALTAISQAQFWNRGARSMDTFGDGRLKGIVSVDISHCQAPDEDGVRLIDETSREGILRRTLEQMCKSLGPREGAALQKVVFAAHLDDELTVGPMGVQNAVRLLIHPPGSRSIRPTASTGLPNLFLASDYLRTEVDLASMEGANEAGRHAASRVLDVLSLDTRHIRFHSHAPLRQFASLRKLDALAWKLGQPHLLDLARSFLAPVKPSQPRP